MTVLALAFVGFATMTVSAAPTCVVSGAVCYCLSPLGSLSCTGIGGGACYASVGATPTTMLGVDCAQPGIGHGCATSVAACWCVDPAGKTCAMGCGYAVGATQATEIGLVC